MAGFWTLQAPEGGLTGVLSRAKIAAKQAVAGLADVTVANSALPNDRYAIAGYRPAILDQPFAMAGLVSQITGHNPPAGGYLSNALTRTRLAQIRDNKTFGVNDPQSAGEAFFRVAGGLAVPGPKAGLIAKAASGASKAERIARTVARGTVEAVSPLNQTGVKGAVYGGALGASLQTGMQLANGDHVAHNKQGAVATPADLVSGNVAATPSPDQEMGQLLSQREADMFDNEVDTDHEAAVDANKQNRWAQGAAVVGTLLGGAAVGRYLGRTFDSAAESSFVGKQFQTSLGIADSTGLKNKVRAAIRPIRTGVLQADQPLRDVVNETFDAPVAANYNYKLDLLNRTSIGAKVRDQFVTGRLAGTDGRTVKLAPLAEAFSQELSPLEQAKVGDALLAASALDDVKAGQPLSALNKDRAGNIQTPADLQNLVLQVQTDPKMGKYFSAVQQSYRDMLKYQKDRGLITADKYTELSTRRPNYVEFNRNLERDANPFSQNNTVGDANDLNSGLTRATEEGGGVQGDQGIGHPFHGLFNSWQQRVHQAELNDLRSSILGDLSTSGALGTDGKPLVKEIAIGTAPKSSDLTHTVYDKGQARNYYVNDPVLDKSLRFLPRASYKALEQMRVLSQSTITGPLATVFNGFGALVSPMYDMQMGTMLRPRGVAIPGIINEMTGLNLPDFTTVISPYIGAARYLWDSVREGVAQHVSTSLMKDNSWIRDNLGEHNANALSDMLSASYEGSIKAQMDRMGVSSHSMWASGDPSSAVFGIEDIAPHFYNDAIDAVSRDVAESAAKPGGASLYENVLTQTKNPFLKLRASTIARVHQTVMEAMHNGYKYQAMATNAARIPDMDKLASQMRRLSVDTAQHGGSDWINRLFGATNYANMSAQTLYRVGRLAATDPVQFLRNGMVSVGGIAALAYGALYSDPAILEEYRNQTPEQKSRAVMIPGGIKMALDPIHRLWWSLAQPVLDKISGATEGKLNTDFGEVINSWLDNDPVKKEQLDEAQKLAFTDALKSANPVDPTAVPLIGAALSWFGLDPSATRMTGEPTPVREQKLTGLEDEAVSRPGAIGPAYIENMISSVIGTVGRSMYSMADDFYRAQGKGAPISDALGVAGSRYKDTLVKGSGLVKPLFGDYETVKSIADTNFHLMQERQDGVDKALKVFQKDMNTQGYSSTGNRYTQKLPEEEGVIPPELSGTELEYIATMAQTLKNKLLAPYSKAMTAQKAVGDTYKAQYLTSIESRNKKINPTVDERKHINMMMLAATRQYEEMISNRIGRPFRFDEFNPSDYQKPIQAAPQ